MSEERKTVDGLISLMQEGLGIYAPAVEAYARALVEQERQSSVNAELQAALKLCKGWADAYGQPETREIVNAVIARAEAAQKGKT